MSLATRCSECGTIFRVVQDQLRVSEGWVRCGRCDAVFNALEGLLDLQRDGFGEQPTGAIEMADAAMVDAGAAETVETVGTRQTVVTDEPEEAVKTGETGETIASDPPGAPPVEDDRRDGAPDEQPADYASLDTAAYAYGSDAGAADRPSVSIDDEIDEHLFGQRHALGHRGAPNVDQRDRLDFSDARFDSDLPADALLESPSAAEAPLPEAAALPLEVAVAPEFLRRAERRAHWRSRPVRGALAAAALLLTATLVLQAAHHFRDSWAAHWPQARPLLAAWCSVAGCSLNAPRRIGEISVESTALTRAAGLDAFRLAVMLRSHSALPLALPSVELSLTDASGQLVARRALTPADFRVASTVLPPGGELPLRLLFDARDGGVTGYTVEIFYP